MKKHKYFAHKENKKVYGIVIDNLFIKCSNEKCRKKEGNGFIVSEFKHHPPKIIDDSFFLAFEEIPFSEWCYLDSMQLEGLFKIKE